MQFNTSQLGNVSAVVVQDIMWLTAMHEQMQKDMIWIQMTMKVKVNMIVTKIFVRLLVLPGALRSPPLLLRSLHFVQRLQRWFHLDHADPMGPICR